MDRCTKNIFLFEVGRVYIYMLKYINSSLQKTNFLSKLKQISNNNTSHSILYINIHELRRCFLSSITAKTFTRLDCIYE